MTNTTVKYRTKTKMMMMMMMIVILSIYTFYNLHIYDIHDILGYIDHQGVCVDAGHCVCYVKHNNECFHCRHKLFFKRIYSHLPKIMIFYFVVKQIDIGMVVSEYPSGKIFLGGHKPFSKVSYFPLIQ